MRTGADNDGSVWNDLLKPIATITEATLIIRTVTTVLYGMPLFMIVGMILLAYLSESVKWYHVLGTAIFSVAIFSNSGRMTFGVIIKLLAYLTIVFLIYLFIKGYNGFGYLMLLSFGMLFFWELTYYIALKEIVSKILIEESILTDLWERKVVSIRFVDGRIVNKERTTSPN